jgi:tetratricopeptide (TPR) repeat protein
LGRLRRYEEARTALEDALAINRQSGERLLEAHTLAALGDVAHETGRFDAALAHFDASLAIRRQIDDRRGEGWMLHHLARTRARMGDASGAEALFGEARRIAAECGDATLGRACGSRDTNSSSVAQAYQE